MNLQKNDKSGIILNTDASGTKNSKIFEMNSMSMSFENSPESLKKPTLHSR
jgi:hypothetical protein